MYRISMMVAALCLCWPTLARAQMQVRQVDDPPPLASYPEFGLDGLDGLATLNVELVVKHTALRAGGFAWLVSAEPDIPWNAILMVSRLFGSKGRYFDAGVGGVAIHDGVTRIKPTATVGYRIQTRRRFARVGATLSPPRPGGHRARPGFNFSIGQTFGR